MLRISLEFTLYLFRATYKTLFLAFVVNVEAEYQEDIPPPTTHTLKTQNFYE